MMRQNIWKWYGDPRPLKDHTIVIIREYGTNSKPCLHCTNLLRLMGVDWVVYSDGINWHKVRSSDPILNTNHISVGCRSGQQI